MGTPPLQKNGREHAQDRELRELRLNQERDAAENRDDHKAIMEHVVDLVSDKKALRLLGILVGVALGSVAGTIAWFSGRISDNSDHIHEVKIEERGNAAKGFQMAEDLRNDVDHNEEALRELLHRIKPDERRRIGPAEE
jgi:protein involved in sex pheromone biosynthesis